LVIQMEGNKTNESRLCQLVTFLATSLVDEPEEVRVREMQSGDSVIFEVSVAADDMGKIIGSADEWRAPFGLSRKLLPYEKASE